MYSRWEDSSNNHSTAPASSVVSQQPQWAGSSVPVSTYVVPPGLVPPIMSNAPSSTSSPQQTPTTNTPHPSHPSHPPTFTAGNFYSMMMSPDAPLPPLSSSVPQRSTSSSNSSDRAVSPLDVNPTVAPDPVNIPPNTYHVSTTLHSSPLPAIGSPPSDMECSNTDPLHSNGISKGHHSTRQQKKKSNVSSPLGQDSRGKPQSPIRKRRRSKKSSESSKSRSSLANNNTKVAELLSELPGMEHIRWESVLQSNREPDANDREMQKRVQEAETLGSRLFGGDLEKLLSSLLSQHLDFFVDYVRTTFDSPLAKHRRIRDQLWETLKVLREQEHEEGDHSD